MIGNSPAPRGWIEFLPIDGNIGPLRVAPVGPGGAFRATRVPPGRVGIRFIAGVRPPSLGAGLDGALRQLGQAYVIHRTLDRNMQNPLEIDLFTEAMRLASRH